MIQWDNLKSVLRSKLQFWDCLSILDGQEKKDKDDKNHQSRLRILLEKFFVAFLYFPFKALRKSQDFNLNLIPIYPILSHTNQILLLLTYFNFFTAHL